MAGMLQDLGMYLRPGI